MHPSREFVFCSFDLALIGISQHWKDKCAHLQGEHPWVKLTFSLEYWKGLASGTNFIGQNFKSCLEVIHVDIVTVWNFDDPYRVGI